MLVINPVECIDCGVCEPECPADAIKPDTAHSAAAWIETNKKYSEIWPNINKRKDPLPNAKNWDPTELNGYQENKWKFFSEKPGK
jgi:ferredoxin